MTSHLMDDRMDRLNGSPPLEGLAASLQARVRAQLQSKEEDDERHRRADIMAMHGSGPIGSNNIQLVQTPYMKADKYSSGLKRTSPIIENPPRPPKMLYTDCSDGMINPELLHANRGVPGPSRNMALMSPEINSMSTVDDRHHLLRHGRNDVDVGTTSVAKGGNLLLSKYPQQQQQQHHQQQQQPTSSSSSIKVINLPYGGGTSMNSATTGCSNSTSTSSSSSSASRNYSQHQQYRIQKPMPQAGSRPQQHHHRPHGGGGNGSGSANKYHPNSYPSK